MGLQQNRTATSDWHVDWHIDWRRPSNGVMLTLVLAAISLFMLALQVVVHLAGESVVVIFVAMGASVRLESPITALFTVDLAMLTTAAFVLGVYRL